MMLQFKEFDKPKVPFQNAEIFKEIFTKKKKKTPLYFLKTSKKPLSFMFLQQNPRMTM